MNNFVYGDTILVQGSLSGGGTFPGFTSVTNNGTTLTFVAGGQTLGTLGFTGGTSHLVLGQDGNNDEVVTVACFAAGTRILTTAGEVPVEALRDRRCDTDAAQRPHRHGALARSAPDRLPPPSAPARCVADPHTGRRIRTQHAAA